MWDGIGDDNDHWNGPRCITNALLLGVLIVILAGCGSGGRVWLPREPRMEKAR